MRGGLYPGGVPIPYPVDTKSGGLRQAGLYDIAIERLHPFRRPFDAH